LETAVRRGGPWEPIIDECDAVSDEHLIFNRHAFTNECVARDLAPAANLGAALDFDKRADLDVVTNLAPVKIREIPDEDTLP
jgi:hypothetical protein